MFLLFSENCKKKKKKKDFKDAQNETYKNILEVSFIYLEGLTSYKWTGYENKQQPEVIQIQLSVYKKHLPSLEVFSCFFFLQHWISQFSTAFDTD